MIFISLKFYYIENVKNIVRHERGATIKTIIETLEKLNYKVYYKVLNTRDFGLPQNREIVYIICFNLDCYKNLEFKFPELKLYSKLEDVLEHHPLKAKTIERDDILFYKKFSLKTDLFGNQELPNKPIQIGKVNKGGQGERIYHPLGHSVTLSAQGGGLVQKLDFIIYME